MAFYETLILYSLQHYHYSRQRHGHWLYYSSWFWFIFVDTNYVPYDTVDCLIVLFWFCEDYYSTSHTFISKSRPAQKKKKSNVHFFVGLMIFSEFTKKFNKIIQRQQSIVPYVISVFVTTLIVVCVARFFWIRWTFELSSGTILWHYHDLNITHQSPPSFCSEF